MTKTYTLKNLGCANCAAKMERSLAKLEHVESASVAFMQQKLTLVAPEEYLEQILEQAQKAIKKIEPGVQII